jgi:hypothetical protein
MAREYDLDEILRQPQSVSFRKLTEAVIHQVLHRLEQQPGFESAFLREAMRQAPTGKLVAHWALASEALSKTGRQYSIGDAAFRDTLARLQVPWVLAACQAGTIAAPCSLVVAAALAKDGGEASADALMADFERARADDDDWALRYKLKRLSKYAKATPEWKALSRAVADELARRDGVKAETSCALKLGVGVPLCEYSLSMPGTRGNSVWVTISDRAQQVSLSISTGAPVGERDLGSTDVLAFPAALAAYASRAKVSWKWGEARVRTSLRGKKRELMLAWLKGERTPPLTS